MSLFLVGLALFFGIHVITVTPVLRALLAGNMRPEPWKGIVSLFSFAGVVLICIGWSRVPVQPLFAPVPFVRQLSPVLICIALILITMGSAGAIFNGYLRRTLHHPMVAGTALWAITHLLSIGSLRASLLFGSFLVYALYAYVTLLRRGKLARFQPDWRCDLRGALAGLIAFGILWALHPWLFGPLTS